LQSYFDKITGLTGFVFFSRQAPGAPREAPGRKVIIVIGCLIFIGWDLLFMGADLLNDSGCWILDVRIMFAVSSQKMYRSAPDT